jgi:hypothetical protein
MKTSPDATRKFKYRYNGIMYEFFVPNRIYDKSFKENSRKFARMVGEAISETEERLRIRVFVGCEHPLTVPFFILDRRDLDFIPECYDYILSNGEYDECC